MHIIKLHVPQRSEVLLCAFFIFINLPQLNFIKMEKVKSIALAAAAAIACAAVPASGQNVPIVQTKYTADPAPMVYNDTIFLYTSHDEDDAQKYGFKMKNWLLFTSTDMVNWTDRGPVASLDDFKWYPGDNGAWAIQVVERNGKFYMYCPIHGHGIGVLVADSPYGPFKDPIGKPLVWQREHWDDIDPTVFIDDAAYKRLSGRTVVLQTRPPLLPRFRLDLLPRRHRLRHEPLASRPVGI